jgi:hypothetical protein
MEIVVFAIPQLREKPACSRQAISTGVDFPMDG